MTRERAKELLPIMEAFAAGKVVQSSYKYALDTEFKNYGNGRKVSKFQEVV